MKEEIKSKNITWHRSEVTRVDRENLNGHQAAVLWFTGLSGSGKSSLALEVEKTLYERGCRTYILDGDNIRHGLNKDLGFSPEDREENIRRIGEVAKLIMEAGVIAVTAFISPYRADRDRARAIAEEGRFFEIYLDCPLEVCERRDPTGLYKKARAGQIPEFTGISAPYEAPLHPELVIPTGEESLEQSTNRVLALLEEREIIPRE